MGDKSAIHWTDALVKRFWSYVNKREAGECWPWVGGRFARGYGQFRAGRRKVKAHRCAYELTFGLPRDRVLHRCDNPPCCNPAHLFDGSLSDNAGDRERKGRSAPIPWSPKPGELNPAAKIGRGEVDLIRQRASAGEPQRALATAFGLSQSQIGNIVRGQSWR